MSASFYECLGTDRKSQMMPRDLLISDISKKKSPKLSIPLLEGYVVLPLNRKIRVFPQPLPERKAVRLHSLLPRLWDWKRQHGVISMYLGTPFSTKILGTYGVSERLWRWDTKALERGISSGRALDISRCHYSANSRAFSWTSFLGFTRNAKNGPRNRGRAAGGRLARSPWLDRRLSRFLLLRDRSTRRTPCIYPRFITPTVAPECGNGGAVQGSEESRANIVFWLVRPRQLHESCRNQFKIHGCNYLPYL
jgi:hypothetical protein